MTKAVEKSKDHKDSKHAAQASDVKTGKIHAAKDAAQEKGTKKFETPQRPNK